MKTLIIMLRDMLLAKHAADGFNRNHFFKIIHERMNDKIPS